MSDTTASLRRKIESAGDLQSVVRTMKAVAASSIGQYEQSARALSDYSRSVELGLSACLREGMRAAPNVEPKRRTGPSTITAIVFGSDQGLVGRFNEVVVEDTVNALASLHGEPKVWAVGERVHARLADAGVQVSGSFALPSSVAAITPLVGDILMKSEAHHARDDITELHLFHNRSTSKTSYAPVRERLLPLDAGWRRRLVDLAWPTKSLPDLMDDAAATLSALIREYLFVSLFRACAESLASENASRLAAMERADKNIDELLQNLKGTFHRLRQSGIDEELFDVVSGFEALSTRTT